MTSRKDAVFAEHASPEAIRYQLGQAQAARARWDRRITWLTGLLDERNAQIQAGTWPPASEEPK